jgi:hypothetical protein
MDADPTDLLLVAGAGLDGPGWNEDDLDLVGSCCTIERDLRAAEFGALETVLSHVDDDRIYFPRDEAARTALAHALVRLGWCRQGAVVGSGVPNS